MILLTIARRLSEVSNVPWTDILAILQGQIIMPLVEPLNCVQDDLVQISHRAEYVTGDFIVFLKSTVMSRLGKIKSIKEPFTY